MTAEAPYLPSRWRAAIEALEHMASASLEPLSASTLNAVWLEHTGAAPPLKLQAPLSALYVSPSAARPLSSDQLERLCAARRSLWPHLKRALSAELDEPSVVMSYHTSPPQRLAELEPLCASLWRCGLGVAREARGLVQLWRPSEKSQRSAIAEQLKGYSALLEVSLENERSLSFEEEAHEGEAFEALCAVALSLGPLLAPQQGSELCAAPLFVSPATLFDDLLNCRDLSLKRPAHSALGLQKARAWLQVGLVSEAHKAQHKAWRAKRYGRAHPLTPYHLAQRCPPAHALWRHMSHTPTTLEGRAYALRGALLKAAQALEARQRQAPQNATYDQLDEALKTLCAPILSLPRPLLYTLISGAHEALSSPIKRSAPP